MLLDRMVKWLLPRENSFFVYLDSMAGKMVETANIFAELRTGPGGPEARAAVPADVADTTAGPDAPEDGEDDVLGRAAKGP